MPPTKLDATALAGLPQRLIGLRTTRWVQWLGMVPTWLLGQWYCPHPCVQLRATDLSDDKRYVIAANHQSMADPFLICAALPLAIRRRLLPYRFFAHNGLFEQPLLRWTLLLLGAFPTRSHRTYASGLAAATRLLESGQTVMIFPQGKRIAEPGAALRGVAELARLEDVEIIPVRLRWRLSRRRRVALTIGQPFRADGLDADTIMTRIMSLPLSDDRPRATLEP